jgi:F-type H+-transporting ATPase subunit b
LQIDLFTFIAQIVNFLILVGLLRHFLYRRIVQAMDERRREISDKMDEAEEKRKTAEEKAEEYERKRQQLEDKKKDVLDQAEEDAGKRRKELMEQARRDVEQSRKKWQEAALRQRKSFLNELRKRAGEQVCRISHRVLRDLADEDLERHAVKAFLMNLKNPPENEQKDLSKRIGEAKQLVVRTAFELPEGSRSELKKVLDGLGADESGLEFKRAEDLVCGIELDMGGSRVSWSVSGYLDSLEEGIAGALERLDTGESGEEKEKKQKNGKQSKEGGKENNGGEDL